MSVNNVLAVTDPDFEIQPIRYSWFARNFTCGHKGKILLTARICGEERKFSRQRELCEDCLIKEIKMEIILCCSCNRPIFPTDRVFEDHQTSRKNNDLLIGCMRDQCCNDPSSIAGHWTTDGYKPLFP